MVKENFARLCLCSVLAVTAILSRVTQAPAAEEKKHPGKEYIPRLEKILNRNIVPFWRGKSLDFEHDGYILNIGAKGEVKPGGPKMIVTQARTVWLFAKLAGEGFDKKLNLPAAEVGFRFLKEKMWDSENGGFYWQTDAAGEKKLDAKKHLYGQAFGLYALSEYYLASKNVEAVQLAKQLFELLERKAHDKKYGGYIEFFNRDWSEPPAEEICYLGVPAGLKLMNTHLHLLEALTAFYRATELPLARERLIELINIQSNSVVRKTIGACTDKYDRNWRPRLEGEYARVSYGHDIENVWLLMDACNAAGFSNRLFEDLYRTLFDYSLKYGYDKEKGGFYDSGTFEAPADRRDKVWWVQAEAMVSALHMHRLTGEAKYIDIFEQTLGFVEENLVDWNFGEWHWAVNDRGIPGGDKANPWKAGYHNGRAMIQCLELLRSPHQDR